MLGRGRDIGVFLQTLLQCNNPGLVRLALPGSRQAELGNLDQAAARVVEQDRTFGDDPNAGQGAEQVIKAGLQAIQVGIEIADLGKFEKQPTDRKDFLSLVHDTNLGEEGNGWAGMEGGVVK